MSIRELLRPQLEEFQERGAKQKTDEIGRCIDELKANEMNIDAVAAPHSLKYKFIRTFVTRRSSWVYGSYKLIVKVDQELVNKVLQREKWQVASECVKYAEKLERKIIQELKGDKVASVTFEGYLWQQSCLKVTAASGRVVTFVTKTIVNRTKFGDCFFQFPTRVQRSIEPT